MEGIGRVESGSAKPALGVRRPRKCQEHIFQQLPSAQLGTLLGAHHLLSLSLKLIISNGG